MKKMTSTANAKSRKMICFVKILLSLALAAMMVAFVGCSKKGDNPGTTQTPNVTPSATITDEPTAEPTEEATTEPSEEANTEVPTDDPEEDTTEDPTTGAPEGDTTEVPTKEPEE